MPGIPLRNKKTEIIAFAWVDTEDFQRISELCWHRDSKGYARTSLVVANKRIHLWMHRLILGDQAGLVIDHKNLNRLDNRRENIRHSTRSQNAPNKRKSGGTSYESEYKGVVRVEREGLPPRYKASLMKDGKYVLSSLFATEEDAALAYDQAAIKFFGEFANTNFSDSASTPAPQKAPVWGQRLSTSKLGYRGVPNRKGQFGAQIYDPVLKKVVQLGVFPTLEKAAAAYDLAALERYGEQSILNFPQLNTSSAQQEIQ
ncbi:HNH endonuclease [Deinococcus oregonensis]|uniref:HNH endonuclease n=1 Tax=Deinococcus oregonensis TaxID=1805970 RepID=A0ABV6B0C1_9DEIO